MQYLHTSNLPAKCVVEITITSIISSTQLKGERGLQEALTAMPDWGNESMMSSQKARLIVNFVLPLIYICSHSARSHENHVEI